MDSNTSPQSSKERPDRSPGSGLGMMPGVYLRVLADLVRKLGHDETQLFRGLSVAPADLLANDSRAPIAEAVIILDRAVALAGSQGLSLLLARELRVTIHGTLGLAALTSPDVASAWESVRRYLQLRAPFVSLVIQEFEDRMLVQFRMDIPLPSLNQFLVETVSATLLMLFEQLVDPDSAREQGYEFRNHKIQGVEVHLQHEEPSYYREMTGQLPVPLFFGKESNVVIFQKALLKAKMRLADADASAMARDQCEFELQKALREQGDISMAVRNMLHLMPGPLPSLEAMAERFCVSSRTLKRRLADRDTTYREIVESVLKNRAIQLLRYTNQSVSEIAYELGYADLSNFSRAFRKWTGKSASEFRDDGPDPAPELGP